jgi:FlaA1/EpsC-like NDP-sugar epimerase
MQIHCHSLFHKCIHLNTFIKRTILYLLDLLLISSALLFSYLIRFEEIVLPSKFIIFIIIFFFFFSSYIFKAYNFSLRFLIIDDFIKKISQVIIFNFFILFLFSITLLYFNPNILFPGLPRVIPLIFSILTFIFLLCSRIFFLFLFKKFLSDKDYLKKPTRVVVIFFDKLSINSISFLRKEFSYNILGIAMDSRLNSRFINNIPVINLKYISDFVEKNKIELLIIFSNELIKEKNLTLDKINQSNCEVRFVNSNLPIYNQLQSLKKSNIFHLFSTKINKSFLQKKKLNNMFFKKTFLITGAGGTIGSEICNQLFKFNPKKIILIDNSEFNLFQVYHKLSNKYFLNKKNTELIPILLNIENKNEMQKILFKNNIDFVFHAAAYKHVELGEKNKQSYATNNVLGMHSLLTSCLENNIKNFVNISTDKAVYPKTFMGKTKRINEMMLKTLIKGKKINYLSVRFGNVLGSSGSVVSIFQNQILQNQPLTIFGKETERFFMLTEEAVNLVFRSLNLNLSGDIVVLDIAKPYKIIEIAKKVANYYNRTIDTTITNYELNKIPVKFSKLKKYEKVTEDLFYNNRVIKKKKGLYILEKADNLPVNEIEIICNTIRNNFSENIFDKYFK